MCIILASFKQHLRLKDDSNILTSFVYVHAEPQAIHLQWCCKAFLSSRRNWSCYKKFQNSPFEMCSRWIRISKTISSLTFQLIKETSADLNSFCSNCWTNKSQEGRRIQIRLPTLIVAYMVNWNTVKTGEKCHEELFRHSLILIKIVFEMLEWFQNVCDYPATN